MSAPRGDLDELPARLQLLRELVRDAHGATKDLRAAIREAKALEREMAETCAKAAGDAAIAEMDAFAVHIQREMNEKARDLNRAVDAARRHVVRSLTMASLVPDDQGGLRVTFHGAAFDEDPGRG